MSEPVTLIPLDTVSGVPLTPPSSRPTAKFMFAHPAHLLALGFGSGLSRIAPGTSGTLWAWVAFVALQPWLGADAIWWSFPFGSLLSALVAWAWYRRGSWRRNRPILASLDSQFDEGHLGE